MYDSHLFYFYTAIKHIMKYYRLFVLVDLYGGGEEGEVYLYFMGYPMLQSISF